jgi:5-hydroxyisourate hydrolase
MLEALERRLGNDAEAELAEASEQQRQITRLRLEKLVRPVGMPAPVGGMMRAWRASPTHVLDTSVGRPAEGVPVVLEQLDGEGGRGGLGCDRRGRPARGPPCGRARSGRHRTGCGSTPASYFASRGVEGFYPEIAIRFASDRRGRAPPRAAALSPFGYSTYRGS